MSKNFLEFKFAMSIISWAEYSLRTVAISSATKDIISEFDVAPLMWYGARKGESVSKTNFSIGISRTMPLR